MDPFPSPHTLRDQAARVAWQIVYFLLFRLSPKPLHAWRRAILRLFGARLGHGSVVHSSVKIWAPWNLEMGKHSCLAPFVDCYNVAKVTLGDYCTVSQYSYLCAATHDYTCLSMPLVPKPIRLGSRVWIAADVFVAPGVTVGDGAVVGARSSVFRDVPSWTVVAGSPARLLKPRVVTKEHSEDIKR